MLPALLALVASAHPAGAIPGPDPEDADPEFSIVVTGTNGGETEVFDEIVYQRAAGWDFGDREAYRCAFVEYIVSGEVLFKLEYERLDVPNHDENYIVINDRGGMETGEGGIPGTSDVCGLPAGSGARVWDGSPFVPGGATFTVYRDGTPFTTIPLPAVAPGNDETFWSVGDEPGEAYMWYVEPGEANDAVIRFAVVPVASGVSLSPTPPPGTPGSDHESTLTLRLEGRLRASGHVRVPDGPVECRVGRVVVIERRSRARWANVGRDLTTATGSFSKRLGDEEGVYRARVLRSTLASGEVCGRAKSRRVVHQRAA